MIFGDRTNRDRADIDRDRSDRGRNSWSQNASRIRNDWGRRNRNDLPFRYGFWDNYSRNRWPAFGPWEYTSWRNRPYYWWGYTPASRLTNWLVFGWNRPRYWDYGPGGNIYYQDDYVYYDGERYLPVNDYYQRMYDLAHSVPQIDPGSAEKLDWSPLGVFAVARDNDRNEGDERTMQLAVDKNGVLAGTFFNAQSKQAHPLTGMVDKRTQRAAWSFADGEQPKVVFETSVFNLTKPDTTMMVHFGPNSGDTEVWHLVRIERPEAEDQGSDQNDSGAVSAQTNDLP